MQIPWVSASKKIPLQTFNKISALPIKTNPPSISLDVIVFLASKILSHVGLDLR